MQGTHFVLDGMPSVARFLYLSRRVQRQLASTPGLIGYALYAEPLGKAYWTVSAWADRAAVDGFIATPPHADVMRTLPGAMRATAGWTADGADLPLSWPAVLGRLTSRAETGVIDKDIPDTHAPPHRRSAMDTIGTLSLMPATITMGLVAGVFVLFWHTVMPGLATTDDRTFVSAFQSMDRAIYNPWFMGGGFLGALIFTARRDVHPDRAAQLPWIAVALVLYMVMFVITIAINVPLNDALKAAGRPTTSPTSPRSGRRSTRPGGGLEPRALIAASPPSPAGLGAGRTRARRGELTAGSAARTGGSRGQWWNPAAPVRAPSPAFRSPVTRSRNRGGAGRRGRG